jgi:hypothetical protein
VIQEARVTCPHCKKAFIDEMPLNYCARELKCPACSAAIKAKEGECCVFCSHSNVICPPEQEKRDCCSG